jgi:hypothetical protein
MCTGCHAGKACTREYVCVRKVYPRSNQHEKVHICTYLHIQRDVHNKFHSNQHKVHTLCTYSINIDFPYEWINKKCSLLFRCPYM